MNCYYYDKIKGSFAEYRGSPASFDLGSEAPRCSMHWRYVCARCGEPSHFMSTAYDSASARFFCSDCAASKEEVADQFWAWSYYFRYRSPWTERWSVALDRLEFEGQHPLQGDRSAEAAAVISPQEYIERYPDPRFPYAQSEYTDLEVQANWDANADRWDSLYDDDGDRTRRYQSDEPMLGLLGDVAGRHVLDVGSGNGYLCRKLARMGAAMTGVEVSNRFMEIAKGREQEEHLGIDYRHASASEMDFLPDAHFEKAVANYILMDIRDYTGALAHVFRVLKPGGHFVAVVSHPSFMTPGGGWTKPALDSSRLEDRTGGAPIGTSTGYRFWSRGASWTPC